MIALSLRAPSMFISVDGPQRLVPLRLARAKLYFVTGNRLREPHCLRVTFLQVARYFIPSCAFLFWGSNGGVHDFPAYTVGYAGPYEGPKQPKQTSSID